VPASLYQRILGEDFSRLPEPLRRFHGSPEGGRVEGIFRVERGAGWVRGLLAGMGRLPPASERIPLRLEVRIAGDEEHWTRSFGEERLVTRQFAHAGRLVELHPPWKLRIRLGATPRGMQLEHERCYWLGIPLPRAIAPRVESFVEARGESWFVAVTIGLPLVGMVCRYSGEVRPA
jgi:Domain of unknown function (DUF4166)